MTKSIGGTLRPRILIYVAFGGAAIALLAGIGLFFAPFGASQNLANRGTAAAALVSGFAVVLTALALVATVRVESSDFRAEERVKEDVACLLASFRSIYLKAAWLTQQSNQLDDCHASLFNDERRVIQDFLNSTTALAFNALEGRMSRKAGSRGEEWRLFPLYMIELLRAAMPGEYRLIAQRAVRAEHLVTQLRHEDIAVLSADVANLSQAIEEFAGNRSETTLARAAYDVFGGAEESEDNMSSEMDQLRELKRQGVEDPDIELFLAVDRNVPSDVKKALDDGAHVNITIGEVLSRYRDRLSTASRSEPE
jgi:hypothetical protein